jgi:hypothetical protein
MLRRQHQHQQQHRNFEEAAAAAMTSASIGPRSRAVLQLEAYEWVRVEARGVLWVEEGPARLVLRPGERIVSGPHQRLDLPTTFSSAFPSLFVSSFIGCCETSCP